MSSFSTVRRLRGILAVNNHTATTKTPITSSNSTNQTPQAIVNFLKESSQHPKFRREGRVHYELAVHRLAKAYHFSGIEEIIEHQKRSERYDEIGGLFRELPAKLSIEPNLLSYNLAIKALCKAGSFDSAVLLMDEIEKNGIKPNTVTCNTLLIALYESQRISEAENLWVVMENRNIIPDLCSYNIRLRSLAKVNEVSKAIQFFEEIVKKGFKPDKFSYNTMIRMYIDEGNLEEAKMW
uniref:Pentatricopeptide repeat-containing protein At1g55890, mitochondrial-like n=2 Tax=Nicotiana TaxID=4085 RepID=A0A1S4CR32_TOBAC|nr:PREDICTED: pentatricopeptide repeat-containing protein At1g55890, mitochondrial-like [Nicotiana sylvestris]XP_016503565.1 PREDICTED: pentatricopeptide repeat-containing protein At1g55890, mitochondrial-like [Nicotiana tabacum]